MHGLTISKLLAAIVLGVLLGAPAIGLARPVTYECTAQQRNYASEAFGRFDNLIQPRMTVVVDAERNSATVEDALIIRQFGGPIRATITEDSGRKLVVKWRFPVQGFNLAQTQMEFRASLIKSSSKLIVTQTALSGQERFFARGGCVALGA